MDWVIILLLSIVSCVYSSPLRNILIESRLPDLDGIVMGVDVSNPRISWSYPDNVYSQQMSYQIIIYHPLSGSSVWDSTVIQSKKTLHVKHEGAELLSDSRYTVKITSWSDDGKVYAGSVQFHTGLNDFSGTWIGHTQIYMNQLRKEFTIPSAITEATAFICGLGYYELYFNNQNVDPTRKLDPGWTTYETRALYATFNVTSFLKVGTNCAGVLLGNGWYSENMNSPPDPFRSTYGPPKLLFQLNVKLANGNNVTVLSDTTWQGRQGFILSDFLFGGETIDARLIQSDWATPGFKDLLNWIAPQVLPAPGGVLTAQMMEPIRTDATLVPIKIWSPSNNLNIIDFGQNMAGWVRFKLTGPRGATVQFRYAEILEQRSSGIYTESLYMDNLRGAAQTDYYILNGTKDGEVFEPRFTVHGFRYVEVRCSWSSVKGTILAVPVHSQSTTAGTFKSDNGVLNQIQSNILWGQKSNLMSVPTDCPQRDERKGWMGDAALSVDEALFNFQVGPLYQGWALAIKDTQMSDGSVGDTTPFVSGQWPADPAWGTAYPTVVTALYDHLGDTETAAFHYTGLQGWVNFLTAQVAKTGYANMYYHYGDWVPPPPSPNTNQSLTSVASYAIDVRNLARLAGALGKTADQQTYNALYATIGQEFHKAFYDNVHNCYSGPTLTAQVLAMEIDAVPASLKTFITNFIVKIVNDVGVHSVCGVLGAKYLYPVLSENGQHNLALKVATSITYPSLGYMFNNPYENATTLWEVLNAPDQGPVMNSRNHIMAGSIGAWFYRYIAGIKPNALEEIEISPAPVGPDSPVTRNTANYDTLKGQISVNWEKKPDSFGMNVVIPATTTARVVIPHHESPYSVLRVNGETIVELKSGKTLFSSALGVQPQRIRDDGSIELKVQPGEYSFFATI